ncbi:hypothetical protein JG688_00013728 [Phytophthora aleatoria]|uniref:Uncharacterized protein n=1 Tax=Phytophthora aleatoria TaxID=2496075 RepID=A0A8J5J1C8_9STRA|nr:hypothetical protein JG688_00013728 [Phytophthora aleatoria]
MVNLGGESKQELFDGGLVTNNGRDDGTNLAVRESVRDGCMRWKGKPVGVWKLVASAKQTDAKDNVMEVAAMVTSG